MGKRERERERERDGNDVIVLALTERSGVFSLCCIFPTLGLFLPIIFLNFIRCSHALLMITFHKFDCVYMIVLLKRHHAGIRNLVNTH